MTPRIPKTSLATAAAPTDTATTAAAAIKTRSVLKKKDFMDRAIERSGVRKSDAKAAVEATLAVLAEALAKGEELVLPPLGKIKVTREKTNPRGRILMLRLVLAPDEQGDEQGDEPGDFAAGSEPLAEAAE